MNTDIHFPVAGIDCTGPYSKQPARKLDGDLYARTTRSASNVRGWAVDGRKRGGSRSGLVRHIDEAMDDFIQGLNVIVGAGYSAPGGGMQTSNSGRVVTLVAVANGTVKVADAGAANWTATTNGTSALNATGLVFSAANQMKLWFADGTNWKYYDPSDNTVHDWTATAGTLPVDSDTNAPRLICTWRGRTCLAGLLGDPLNVFMSKVGDPTDFDYSPLSPSAIDAVVFNASLMGNLGDIVTAIIPLNDDLLMIAGDHTLWMLRGDPLYGGQLDRVIDAVGMAWGAAWCRDPHGTMYFVSNRMGIYKFSPGDRTPLRISQPIEQLVAGVNTGERTISLGWDDSTQSLHVFVTTTAGAADDEHYCWEARTGAWWVDWFVENDHNPLCVCVFDGNRPEDRALLIGSWDGYVRKFDADAETDDGQDITSEVWIGPFNSPELDEMHLRSVQAVMGETSGDVTFSVHPEATAEGAIAADAMVTDVWSAGRNLTGLLRVAAHALYIRLAATTRWAMESFRLELETRGKVRGRGQ